MKRDIWQKIYGTPPESLSQRVSSTLSTLKEEETIMKRYIFRSVALALCLVFLLVGTVWAVSESGILSLLNRYGEELNENQQQMIQTEFDEDTAHLGPITVTLKEMICDGYVATVTFEYVAPEGTYLYTDAVEMTPEEWEMDDQSRLDKYGPYYVLTDVHAGFASPLAIMDPPGESMMLGQRMAPNIILHSLSFPVAGMDLDTLQIGVGAWEVKEAGKQGDRHGAALYPRYKGSTEPFKTFSLSFDPADTPFGLSEVDLAFTGLTTHISIRAQADPMDCIPELLDGEGKELPLTLLGSFGGYHQQKDCWEMGYGPLSEIPDTLQLQMHRWNEEIMDTEPWGDPITLHLK